MGIWFRRKNEKMRMVLREKNKYIKKMEGKELQKIGLHTEVNKKTEFRPRERNIENGKISSEKQRRKRELPLEE